MPQDTHTAYQPDSEWSSYKQGLLSTAGTRTHIDKQQ
jgi:hypothetical protein